jgi:hypothetical protein
MIYYLAGNPGLKQLESAANRAHANNFLFTFKGGRNHAEHFCVQPQRRIFVDSGAFSVWNSGKNVDLGDYIVFCKRIMSMAKCKLVFAALDVISGSKGGPQSTRDEIEKACDEGWNNYQTMKQEGIPCLMTFHQRDHKRWLTRIANDSYYFAVAPRKDDVTKDEKQEFLKSVFDEFKGKDGLPTKKIHGLGVSSLDFMRQFPFYSVDNSDYINSVKFRSRLGWSLADWEKLENEYGVATELLGPMLGYEPPPGYEDEEPDGNWGPYFLMQLAIDRAVETECRITDSWRSRGVDWGNHPRHDRLPFFCNSLPANSSVEA